MMIAKKKLLKLTANVPAWSSVVLNIYSLHFPWQTVDGAEAGNGQEAGRRRPAGLGLGRASAGLVFAGSVVALLPVSSQQNRLGIPAQGESPSAG